VSEDRTEPHEDEGGTCPICSARVSLEIAPCAHYLCVTVRGESINVAPGVIDFSKEVYELVGLAEDLKYQERFDDALKRLDHETKTVLAQLSEYRDDYWTEDEDLLVEPWSMFERMPASSGLWCFHPTPRRFARRTKARARRVTLVLKRLAKQLEQQ
jgi:hypothetical protein